MTMTPFLENLLSWAVQVFVVASVGALLPLVFRIRHPRSHLIYCHALLVASLVAPLVQPWQHPVVVVEQTDAKEDLSAAAPTVANAPQFVASGISWDRVVMGILAMGVAARLCWLLAGLWQIRRYRTSAAPLLSPPQSIETARAMTKANARFCISPGGTGPVTFGFIRPVVLLPESFLSLSGDAQRGIACHELLHVLRSDWLITVFEELIGALLWFHPAVWWLLGQTRLAREQLVDAEVVRLTEAREPYINALLTIAGARPALDLTPAPLFLRRRHLAQRMYSLLTEVSMSRLRLLSSYASMAAILGLAVWLGFLSFPLTGQAEVKFAASQDQPRKTANPGYVVNRTPTEYPAAAIEKKIEGQVVVELTFNAKGEIVDSRVLAGPDGLRKAALQSALRGEYGIDVARSLQVVMEFKLPAVTAIQGRTVTGVALTPLQLAERRKMEEERRAARIERTPPAGFRGNLERIEVRGLSEPLLGNVRQGLQTFKGQPMSENLLNQIRGWVRTNVVDEVAGFSVTDSNDNSAVLITFASPNQEPADRAFEAAPGPGPIRVGGNIQQQNLLQQIKPVYPPLAKQAQIQGVVVLEAEISKEGRVDNLKVITGHPLLIQAAIDAVKQWVYKPVLLNGEPVGVVTTITVNFSFQN